MGCGGSKQESPEEVAQRAKSKKLDADLKSDQERDAAVAKLLLLGAGESGKSTLFKQMIQIYGKGFPPEERKTYIPVVYQNVLNAIRTLVEQLSNDDLKITESLSEEGEEARQIVEKTTRITGDHMDEELVRAIKTLWEEPAIKQVFEQRSKFQLDTSADYFLDRIEEIGAEDYIPSEQDILRCRVRTTGIVENEFVIDNNRFKMFDVGGQRNERKKWIHCFENVTCVIFVAAISEYDQVLYEDENTNRIHEALNLFESIVNSRWFEKSGFILFLNKKDLFQKKIKKVPLTVAFPDYNGPNTYEAGIKFLQKQFESLNKTGKTIYTHVTCATDTNNVAHVFNSVKDTVLKNSLRDVGLLE